MTHFIADCPKRKKFKSSNKYNYNNQNDFSDKNKGKKRYRFGDNKKKKIQKMMSRACAALSDLDISSDDSSSFEKDERPSARWTTSPAFASWVSHRGTSPTPTPM
jgi:hypothetical protein